MYFLSLIIFGNIILLQLFLAVLLENFEEKRKEIEKLKKKDSKMNFYQILKPYAAKLIKILFKNSLLTKIE